ncbi:MAG: hypothetical protein N2035_03395 [Chthoniobacterales bacterium]|nr:hypothetical protein [Chthoniobacterales bacterium]
MAEFHHLGDAVMALPFVRGALEGGHEVEVWCRSNVAKLFELANIADAKSERNLRIKAWEPPWHEESHSKGILEKITEYQRIVKVWIEEGFDVAVTVWADSRVHGLFGFARIPKRVGFPMNFINYYGSSVFWRRRNLIGGKFLEFILKFLLGEQLLTDELLRKSPVQHHLEAWRQIGEKLQIFLNFKPPWLSVKEETISSITREAIQGLPNRRRIFIHPGGRLPCKTWPLEKFKQVVKKLREKELNVSILVCQSPSSFFSELDFAGCCLVPTPKLEDLVYAISVSDIFLGNDSLPAHIAAALGKDVLAIFGSSDPRLFAPANRQETVIWAEGACPYHPCMDRCRQPSFLCLDSVNVEQVFERIAIRL